MLINSSLIIKTLVSLVVCVGNISDNTFYVIDATNKAKHARRLENYFVTSTSSCRCLSSHRYSYAIPFSLSVLILQGKFENCLIGLTLLTELQKLIKLAIINVCCYIYIFTTSFNYFNCKIFFLLNLPIWVSSLIIDTIFITF